MATTPETRVERDSMGTMTVPADAYYGASTARAVENFPISGQRFPRPFIRALGLIKRAAAQVNKALGKLDGDRASAIVEAATEVVEGRLDAHFVLDIFQTGSATSTNTNANEVIANRAGEIMGGERGSKLVHPNDHVNMGQSSNDVIPTAIHVSAREQLHAELIPALDELAAALEAKARAFDDVVKIGRTHLQDATPIRLGQEFGGYAAQARQSASRAHKASKALAELAQGGTAVGTGINTHPEFARRVAERLSADTGLDFREAANHFEAQAAKDACVEASGQLKAVAVALTKIAHDIRWLASGPRCGIGEVTIPATQPGSSIMPGKVNPVMSEALIQVCAQVIGNDAAIVQGGLGSYFELNVMMPLIARNLLESIALLAAATRVFARRCVAGIEADPKRCAELVEQSLALVTALVPAIGYDKAADLAKEAQKTGKTIRELLKAKRLMDDAAIDRVLDARGMTEPSADGGGYAAGG
jgi:fumarate hydratase class II